MKLPLRLLEDVCYISLLACPCHAGGDVLELQRFLHDQGYFPRLKETPDGYTGYFGDVTKEALQAWQEDYHLAADGRFGQSCRQAVARRQVCVGAISACTVKPGLRCENLLLEIVVHAQAAHGCRSAISNLVFLFVGRSIKARPGGHLEKRDIIV